MSLDTASGANDEGLARSQLRARRPVAAAIDAECSRSAPSSKASWQESVAHVRDGSVDSFESASDGGETSHSAAFRPALPKLQHTFQKGEGQKPLRRPDFLPPDPSNRKDELASPWLPEDEGAAAQDEGPDTTDELLTWLSMASGTQSEHIARIVAWLLQLLHFYSIPELAEETLGTMSQLPDATLIRVYAEAESCQETQELGMDSHLETLPTSAKLHLQDKQYQQVALCLAAFAARTDSGACEILANSAAPWSLEALQQHPQDAVIRFWACTLLTSLSKHCRAWSLTLPGRQDAVRSLLTVGEMAARKPGWGPTPRMSIEATCRSLASLWEGAEDGPVLAERALALATRMIDMPSAGVPWAHSSFLLLGHLGVSGEGIGPSPCFAEVCSRLATVLGRSKEATEVGAALEASESLLSRAGTSKHSDDADAATTLVGTPEVARLITCAVSAIQRFSENCSRVEYAGAGLLVSVAELGPAYAHLVQSSSSLNWLQSVVAAGLLPPSLLSRASHVLEQLPAA